jgi:hypothetical protein
VPFLKLIKDLQSLRPAMLSVGRSIHTSSQTSLRLHALSCLHASCHLKQNSARKRLGDRLGSKCSHRILPALLSRVKVCTVYGGHVLGICSLPAIAQEAVLVSLEIWRCLETPQRTPSALAQHKSFCTPILMDETFLLIGVKHCQEASGNTQVTSRFVSICRPKASPGLIWPQHTICVSFRVTILLESSGEGWDALPLVLYMCSQELSTGVLLCTCSYTMHAAVLRKLPSHRTTDALSSASMYTSTHSASTYVGSWGLKPAARRAASTPFTSRRSAGSTVRASV